MRVLNDVCSQPEQIQENVKALELFPRLTPDVVERINKILANKPAAAVSRPPKRRRKLMSIQPSYGRRSETGALI